MKTLLKILALCLPLLLFSQPKDSIEQVVRKTAEVILKEKRSIDSLSTLKKHEVAKQMKLLTKLRKKIEYLKNQAKIKEGQPIAGINKPSVMSVATKPETDTVYWEEVRRKWSGRLFNKEDTRIRLYRYEGGKKVYLN